MLRKIILTGVIIYIPVRLKAALGAIVCCMFCISLNFSKPYSSEIVFWACQNAYLATTLKFISATMFSAWEADAEKDGKADFVGFFLIAVDIIFLLSVAGSMYAATRVVSAKLKRLRKDSTMVIP